MNVKFLVFHLFLAEPTEGSGSGATIVEMEKDDVNILVPCNASIHLTGQCGTQESWGIAGSQLLKIECAGSFDKKVGTQSAGQYNVVIYNLGNAFGGLNQIVPTECADGNTMTCKAYCSYQ